MRLEFGFFIGESKTVIICSVMFTGTHFMRETLDWLGVEYRNIHPAHELDMCWGRGNSGSAIPAGVKVAPLRDPLLTWISHIQRSNRDDWQYRFERDLPFSIGHRHGRNGNMGAWEWLFHKDIAAFVRVLGTEAERAADLRGLIKAVGADTPVDFDARVAAWPKAGSVGDDHPLKAAYAAHDRETLRIPIRQVTPALPEFRARGCKFWWDNG